VIKFPVFSLINREFTARRDSAGLSTEPFFPLYP
jgi:hypothetical protein